MIVEGKRAVQNDFTGFVLNNWKGGHAITEEDGRELVREESNQVVSCDSVKFEIPGWCQVGILIFTIVCALLSCAIGKIIFFKIKVKSDHFFSSMLSNNIPNIKGFVDC